MKILIIENNSDIAQKYKNSLSSAGFQVGLAKSAIEGIKILKDSAFSLILINPFLPDMHGLNLIKNIHKNNPEFTTPFVILTEDIDEKMIQEAYNLNICGYLIHSHYSPDEVTKYIKHALFIR